MMNMNEVVANVTLTKVVSVSPDNDSKKDGIKKTITIKMKYDGLTLADVFQKALKDDVISWANGSAGRKNFDRLVNHQVIEVSAKTPGSAPQADAMETIIASAKASGITVEQYVMAELKKRQ
jgi:ABC-type branched-subunit amino acid transport system substrate-binding protein